jgi:hypothetical protein
VRAAAFPELVCPAEPAGSTVVVAVVVATAAMSRMAALVDKDVFASPTRFLSIGQRRGLIFSAGEIGGECGLNF